MPRETEIYVGLLLIATLAFFTALSYKKDARIAAAAIFFFFLSIGGLWMEWERSGDGKPATEKILPNKTKWTMVGRIDDEGKIITIIKNEETGKRVCVGIETPPRFIVKQAGIFFKTRYLVPLE